MHESVSRWLSGLPLLGTSSNHAEETLERKPKHGGTSPIIYGRQIIMDYLAVLATDKSRSHGSSN